MIANNSLTDGLAVALFPLLVIWYLNDKDVKAHVRDANRALAGAAHGSQLAPTDRGSATDGTSRAFGGSRRSAGRCAAVTLRSMFATLLGALPRPPLPDDAPRDALVEAAVRAQEEAGLDPITDGGPPADDDRDLAARLAATAAPDRPGRQAGGHRPVHGGPRRWRGGRADRGDARPGDAPSTRPSASWPPPAARSSRSTSRPRPRSAPTRPSGRSSARPTCGSSTASTGSHLSLAITGGNADAAGIETLLAAPYASLAVDLIAGPDNWRLVVATPGRPRDRLRRAVGRRRTPTTARSSSCGPPATRPRPAAADRPASGSPAASSLADLPWEVAVRKIERLGEAARLADAAADEPPARARSARGQQPERGARPRRSAAVAASPDPGDDPT